MILYSLIKNLITPPKVLNLEYLLSVNKKNIVSQFNLV